MPRAALTPEQIADFRTRAVDTATRLFAERDYEAVTMRSLAAELGCSPMTPYRYFENREALFTMVRADAFRRFADSQQEAAATAGDARERLLALKRAYIAFALDEPDAYCIMFELRQAPALGSEELMRESARGFSYLHQAVEEAVEQGTLSGDPLTVAHILWANTHGLVSLHLSGKLLMGRSLEELASITMDLPEHSWS